MSISDFYSIKEFAQKLGVHANTVRRSIKNGHINAFRVGAGKKSIYRIPHTEIHRVALLNLEDIVKNIIDKTMNEK